MNKSQFYKRIIGDALEADELTILGALQRFKLEMLKPGATIERRAVMKWLSGLALSVPYMNTDILLHAFELGFHDESTQERTKENLIATYWADLSNELYNQFIKISA